MVKIEGLLDEINIRLEKIDKRFDNIVDWTEHFGIIEAKISNLEKAVDDLKEIKERVVKIEEIISKCANN